ncbi:dimethylarginine dimethylaminohydrolase family protein [Roseovarius sp. M141]|uniref:dimethylarginine dimethylaminohydrolase family protein n=1 Tax=Roseovarius sp. M141 TaxID=2583806 RepID=UPI0020CDF087|nr:arginine deiminase family protein [Roseovarius sp. M141]MCQ0093755.1 dimethylarginine dimethylaminohydrolase [Roseovarius sp. M141]
MTNPATHFTHAISRRPGASVTHGLRAEDRGAPDLARLRAAHDAYVATLRSTGAKVTVLDALEEYPDALFVEDTALCLPEGAVMMRPGAASRMGEVAQMRPALAALFEDLRDIHGPGHIEGGDILFTGREVLVGRSARTDATGVAELRAVTDEWGHSLREVQTPPGVLHFKTDCSLLDPETILSTKLLDASGCFEGYRVLHLPDGEEAAANAIRFNDAVLMPAGFPKAAEMLSDEGYDVRLIDNRDCALLDGGMSCLSLRLNV